MARGGVVVIIYGAGPKGLNVIIDLAITCAENYVFLLTGIQCQRKGERFGSSRHLGYEKIVKEINNYSCIPFVIGP